MSKEKVLFITNKIFIDPSMPMGGVRLCTEDYIKLLETEYEVVFFPVSFNRSILFRLRHRLGIDSYEEYDTDSYAAELKKVTGENSINKVFVNLANATDFCRAVKVHVGNHVKTILCSHGNESGDFLHQTVRFKDKLSLPQRLSSPYRLGRVLQKELDYRLQHVDLVLTVSEVEESIEKWIGAKEVFMVPRVLNKEYVNWQPVGNRVGFIGDISHYPNYYGVLKLCEYLAPYGDEIELRIVGKDNSNMQELKHRFSFITHMGYLDEIKVLEEVATWSYFLNLVFYYSKGVSTKLAQGLNWGLPVISTTPGNRGHVLSNPLPTFDKPDIMAGELISRLRNKEQVKTDREQVLDTVENSITYHDIMRRLGRVLNNI